MWVAPLGSTGVVQDAIVHALADGSAAELLRYTQLPLLNR
jgi:hypothetical protein